MDDPKVAQAAEPYLRVLLRRPHAYRFRATIEGAPIPGFTILDGEGKKVGAVPLTDKTTAEEVAKALAGK